LGKWLSGPPASHRGRPDHVHGGRPADRGPAGPIGTSTGGQADRPSVRGAGRRRRAPELLGERVLSSAAGSFWRRCQDRRTGQSTVSCADEHTGEYVRVQAGTSVDQSRCERATDAYLGAGLSRLGDRLVMRVLADSPPTSDQPHCLVETRGPELLTASIRNIRTSGLIRRPSSR